MKKEAFLSQLINKIKKPFTFTDKLITTTIIGSALFGLGVYIKTNKNETNKNEINKKNENKNHYYYFFFRKANRLFGKLIIFILKIFEKKGNK